MDPRKQFLQLAKTMAALLGRCPHEFGLAPDKDGYVRIKEVLQALSETDGWRHIRRFHLQDLPMMAADPMVEVDGGRIRAKDRSHLPTPIPCGDPPGLLYVAVKPKSYPHVLASGIHPTVHDQVVCASHPEMALRMGRRRDNRPVLVTVHVTLMRRRRLPIFLLGEGLYLTPHVPADCLTGPPPPKETAMEKGAGPKPDPEHYGRQARAGTFTVDLGQPGAAFGKPGTDKHPKGKDGSWKDNKKRLRREKQRYWGMNDD